MSKRTGETTRNNNNNMGQWPDSNYITEILLKTGLTSINQYTYMYINEITWFAIHLFLTTGSWLKKDLIGKSDITVYCWKQVKQQSINKHWFKFLDSPFIFFQQYSTGIRKSECIIGQWPDSSYITEILLKTGLTSINQNHILCWNSWFAFHLFPLTGYWLKKDLTSNWRIASNTIVPYRFALLSLFLLS